MRTTDPIELVCERNIYDPTVLPDAANEFIFKHAGTAPHIVLADIPQIPSDRGGTRPAFNPAVAEAILDHIWKLEESAEHRGQEWVGIRKVKACIRFWIDQYRERWKKARAVNPKEPHPSMAHTTVTGDRIYGARGSDAGRVRTWVDRNGNRHPFALDLQPQIRGKNAAPDWAVMDAEAADYLADEIDEALAEQASEVLGAPLDAGEEETEEAEEAEEGTDADIYDGPEALDGSGRRLPRKLRHDRDKGMFECTVHGCNERIVYDPEKPRAEQMAHLRVRKHLRNPERDPQAHRALYNEVYGTS